MTSNVRRALTWLGAACLPATLVLTFVWTTLHPPSVPQPSTLLPATSTPRVGTPGESTWPPVAAPPDAPTPPSHPQVLVADDLEPERTRSPASVAGSVERPPERSVAATGSTVAAAAEFAGAYFTEAINHAKTTSDTSAIRAWSDISCTLCRRNLTVFATSNQANGLLNGDHRWRDARVSQVHLTDPTTATVDLSLSIGHHTYRPRAGARPLSLPAQTVDLRVTLATVGGNWLMFDWERLR